MCAVRRERLGVTGRPVHPLQSTHLPWQPLSFVQSKDRAAQAAFPAFASKPTAMQASKAMPSVQLQATSPGMPGSSQPIIVRDREFLGNSGAPALASINPDTKVSSPASSSSESCRAWPSTFDRAALPGQDPAGQLRSEPRGYGPHR